MARGDDTVAYNPAYGYVTNPVPPPSPSRKHKARKAGSDEVAAREDKIAAEK